jgi:hypothetical protein
MSSPTTATLTAASPAHNFNMQPGSRAFVATSGVIGASPATLKLQHRTRPSDEWVDNPNLVFVEGEHLAGVFTSVAVYNRIVVADADGTTDIGVSL